MDDTATELTQQEAATLLDLSVRTLQRMRLAKAGPPYRRVTARKIRYPLLELRAWRDRALVQPAE